MKLFSTRVHGVLDYASAVMLFALPRAAGWARMTTRVTDGAALVVLAYSLPTDYELGAVRRLPMRDHLQVDVAFGALCGAAPLLVPNAERPAKAFLLALGLFSLFASQVTETRPRR